MSLKIIKKMFKNSIKKRYKKGQNGQKRSKTFNVSKNGPTQEEKKGQQWSMTVKNGQQRSKIVNTVKKGWKQ